MATINDILRRKEEEAEIEIRIMDRNETMKKFFEMLRRDYPNGITKEEYEKLAYKYGCGQ